MEIQERECLSTHGSAHLTFQFPHAPRELTTKRRNRSSSSSKHEKKRKTVANSMRATSQSCFQLPSQDTLAAFCFLHARHAPCHSHRPLLTPTHHAPLPRRQMYSSSVYSHFPLCCWPETIVLLHFINPAEVKPAPQSVNII